MTAEKKRILVVDDEETLCEVLRFNLEAAGYEVETALSAEEALARGVDGFDLVLLDIMMGEISGLQMAAILKKRPHTAAIPIIFCTARDTEDDMVEGLDIGADDYIAKPYSMRNLLARVRSVLRRAETSEPATRRADSVSFRGLTLDMEAKRCIIDGEEVRLPRKEFEILAMLLSNKGRIFSREELLHKIWPEEVVVVDRVVDVNITRLRRKLGPYGKNIVTRSGYGYGFME